LSRKFVAGMRRHGQEVEDAQEVVEAEETAGCRLRLGGANRCG